MGMAPGRTRGEGMGRLANQPMARSRAATAPNVAAREGPFDLAEMQTHSDPVELTVQLMSIDSTSGREGQVIEWLDHYLAERGWRTQRIPVSANRDDLYATVSDAPTVTLSTHL